MTWVYKILAWRGSDFWCEWPGSMNFSKKKTKAKARGSGFWSGWRGSEVFC